MRLHTTALMAGLVSGLALAQHDHAPTPAAPVAPVATAAAAGRPAAGHEWTHQPLLLPGMVRGERAAARLQLRGMAAANVTVFAAAGPAERWLIDPPREGAFALVKALAEMHATGVQVGWRPPQRILYVSCNPATLARDAGLLVNEAGYTCTAAGVVNMFPHTAHVESIAVFEKLSA